MDLSRLMMYAEQVEDRKLCEESMGELKRPRVDGCFNKVQGGGQRAMVLHLGKGKQKVNYDQASPPCPECGRYHPGECLAGMGVGGSCGSTDHKLRHCPWVVKNEKDSCRRSQPYPSRGPPK